MVEAIINFAINSFLLFYLTIVCGLSGVEAGLVALISLAIDALIDPLVGSLSDNLHSRFGRRHPFLILAPVPTAAAMVLLFSVPSDLAGGALFAYATVLSLALRLGLSCFQLPYFALGAELSDDYRERSTIVAFRVAMGVVATLAATLLSYRGFLAAPGATTHRLAYVPLGWSLGALIVGGGLLAGFGTLNARARLHAPPARQGSAMSRMSKEVGEVFRNPSFRILFASALIFFVAVGVALPLTLHANTYFWRLTTATIGNLALVYTAGLVIGIGVATALLWRFEKRTVAMLGLFSIFLSQCAPTLLRLGGLLPTVGLATVALSIGAILFGAGISAATIGYQSMMADAADEHEQLFGARREGLYFAGINLSAKASSGLGTFIAGMGLDVIGFPHDLAAKGVAGRVSLETVRSLGLLYGPGASLVTFFAIITLFGYRLNRRTHASILNALDVQRAAGQHVT